MPRVMGGPDPDDLADWAFDAANQIRDGTSGSRRRSIARSCSQCSSGAFGCCITVLPHPWAVGALTLMEWTQAKGAYRTPRENGWSEPVHSGV